MSETPPPAAPRPRPRRWLKRLLVGLGVFVGLLLLLLGGAWLYVTSDAGGALIKEKALAAANETLKGRIEASRVSLSGGRLVLDDAKLYTPEGELVARVGHLEADLRLSALSSGKIVVDDAQLSKVELYLVSDERGLNLLRAVELRAPSPDTGGPPANFDVEVKKLSLRDGVASFKSESQNLALEKLNLDGRAHVKGSPVELDASVSLKGALASPLAAPVVIEASARTPKGAGMQIFADATVGDSKVKGQLSVDTVEVKLDDAVVAPELLRAFVPALKLKVPVRVTGTASPKAADVVVRAGGAKAVVKGAFDLSVPKVDSFALDAEAVDLSELIEGGKKSKLSAQLTGSLLDSKPESFSGAVKGTVRWDEPSGKPLASADLDVTAKDGELLANNVHADFPGASVDVRGDGTAKALKLFGVLSASDLRKTARAIGELTGTEPPALSGEGALALSIRGIPSHPGVSARGGFSSLGVGSLLVKDLSLDLKLPDVRRPLETQGTVFAQRLILGDQSFEKLSAKIGTQGRNLRADITTEGARQLTLHLAGLLDPGSDGVQLTELGLTYPENAWSLEKPTHLSWLASDLALDDLALTSPAGRLEVSLSKKGSRLDLATHVSALDLSKLPRAFLPSDLKLEGVVDGRASVKGSTSQPDVGAQLGVKGAKVNGLGPIDAQVNATYVRERANGTVVAKSTFGALDSQFDLPLRALMHQRDEKISGTVNFTQLDAAKAAKALGKTIPVEGLADVSLVVTGTGKTPELSLHVESRNLAVLRTVQLPPLARDGGAPEVKVTDGGAEVLQQSDGGPGYREPILPLVSVDGGTPDAGNPGPPVVRPEVLALNVFLKASARTRAQIAVVVPPPTMTIPLPLDALTLDVTQSDAGTLQAKVAITALGGLTAVTVKTPFTAGGLLRDPPKGTELLETTPLQISAAVDGVDLETFGEAGLPGDLKGKLSLTLDSTGPLLHPDLEFDAQVRGLAATNLPPTDVLAQVKATRNRVVAGVKAERERRVLASLEAHLDAPVEAFADLASVKSQPMQLELNAGPLNLSDVLALTQEEGETPPSGELNAQLSLSGTLADPKGRLRATLDKFSRGKVALGTANVAWDYANAKHGLTVALGSPGGGRLKVRGDTTLELGLDALLSEKGLALSEAPLDVTLESEKFDLAFLSGVHPMVRTLGGTLQANATVKGVLRNPLFNGKIRWTGGKLGLAGFGEYRDVELNADGSNDLIVLHQLSAKAGGGNVFLQGEARRTSGETFALKAAGQTRNFPLVVEDQLVAIASLSMTLEGKRTPREIEIRYLKLPDVHIELPDVKSKDLQPLERPADIILVKDGVPLFKKKKASAAASEPGTIISIYLDAPRNIWVKSSDLNVEVGLSNDFRVEIAEQTLLYGTVQVQQGRVDVIGRRFDVQRDSTVRFAGPPKQAYLNLSAVHVNEREGITVYVNVGGRGTAFTLKTSSSPPLGESEIYTLLATGRRNLKRGSGASITPEQAASVVGALAATQLKGLLSKGLPLDVLSIEAGNEGVSGTRIEAGTYLNSDLYLGFNAQVGADARKGENTVAGRLEYSISSHWSLEGFAGNAGAAGADIVWTREY